MLIRFFMMLRAAGVPVSITEFLALLEGLQARLIGLSVDDFYWLARTVLVKDERHFDRFDQVFGAHFRGIEQAFEAVMTEIPADWMRKNLELSLSDEDKARIAAEGSPRELIERYSTREVTEMRFPVGVQETLDGKLDGLADRIEWLPDRVLMYANDGEAVSVAVHERGLRPETTLVRRSTLEDVFLRLTGRTLIE